ncbi:MAG: ABC transporter permease, partial [Gemmatimonadales bacterium]
SREELAFWVRNLSVDDARAVSSRMSHARYLRIDLPDASFDELNQMLINDGIFAYFVIGEDPLTSAEGSRYVSRNLTDDDLKDWFSRNATAVVRSRRLAQENISPQIASWIQQPVRFEARRIGDTGREEDVRDEDQLKQWAPVAFLYLLWISVFTSSQMLLTNTIEEKSNRIMEVLLSSVSPLQLMVGKIAGIAGSGLILIGSWILMFYVGTKYLPGILGASPTLDLSVLASDPKYILAFGFYYLFGYLLYASLLVAIGSVVNTLKEAQNLMGPITLLLMVPLIAMIPIGKDPNGTLAQVMSYIPPFTPFVMMNRAAGPPSTFEYVSTTVLLIVSVLVAMWAAAKIFRIGILMTGKAPKFREILRWLRAPVGAVPEAAE